MTDKPRDLGDWQSAVDAYVAAGYSREGAEAAIDQHCAIVAAHSPKIIQDIHKAIAVADFDPAPMQQYHPEPVEEPAITDPVSAIESHQQPPLGLSDANPEQH